MNTSTLDIYVIKILRKNGWIENRKYDISSWIKCLTAEGYVIHDYAYSILEELGNIEVWERSDGKHSGATFHFNPYYAASGEYDRIEEFEKASGDKLFPIGELQQMIMYAGKSKRIYLGDWAELLMAGETIEEFLNNIFTYPYEPINIPLDRGE